ncbi:hypothetical protein L3X38_039128 [Prunus dulcis]|uniref:MULE transposase domain-containing protein n=1 Tax=Prunus dulcis TaxID=3755 RepID=A0AAD4YS58_PRUDU|nr:hypothetical protein L3X38_039128 [Prunus dulcis]
MIEGSYKEQYARLRDYAEELKKANKGSTVVIQTEQVGAQAIFLRMYVCLAGCRQGFLDGCRPVIGLDGCHVKGPYPGQILTAVGVDGNNGSFPIAYAVVEIESKQSWIWFLRLLIEDLKITSGLSYVFISDKQKGLIPAIETLLPTVEHRMCVRHLHNNFRSAHSGVALKHILWAAARATTIPWWEAEMENMKQEDEEAWEWLTIQRNDVLFGYSAHQLLHTINQSPTHHSILHLNKTKPLLYLTRFWSHASNLLPGFRSVHEVRRLIFIPQKQYPFDRVEFVELSDIATFKFEEAEFIE